MSLAQQVIEIETQVEGVDSKRYLECLDGITDSVLAAVQGKKAAVDIIGAMSACFFETEGFYSEDSEERPFLYQTLDSHKGDCYSLSMLYLIAADSLGLPIYPVLAPKHIFCRWADSRNSINIETTNKGKPVENHHYVERSGISNISIQKGAYMKNVNRNGLLGLVYDRRGVKYAQKGLKENSLEDATLAIKLAPRLANAYFNRANDYAEQEKYQEALNDLGKAISLDPNYAKAFESRGYANLDLGYFEKAVSDFSIALKTNPDASMFKYRAMAHSHLSDFKLALADLNAALQLEPEDCLALVARGCAYAELGQREKALADLSVSLEGIPDAPLLLKMKEAGYKVLRIPMP